MKEKEDFRNEYLLNQIMANKARNDIYQKLEGAVMQVEDTIQSRFFFSRWDLDPIFYVNSKTAHV